jgi:hypothetical protein
MDGERIKQFARNERAAGWAGFLWGFAEGLFFFIVPDVYVTFATLYSIRAGVTAWIASIAGSLVAVSVIYLLSSAGVAYVRFLAAVPGISWTMIEHVKALLRAGGLPYTPLLITGGVPLKVYAGMAFSLGMSLGAVLLWTVFARLVRIAPVFLLAAATRLLFKRSIDQHAAGWCILLAAAWAIFYTLYFVYMLFVLPFAV